MVGAAPPSEEKDSPAARAFSHSAARLCARRQFASDARKAFEAETTRSGEAKPGR
jgi:hypothetical protein